MPRKASKLSNCYVPLPLPTSTSQEAKKIASESKSSTRSDGRSSGHELRRLFLETSVISRAMGSALVELGHTKILAEVHIAVDTSSNSEATTDVGSLKCTAKYAPHIGMDPVAQRSRSVLPLDGATSSTTNNSSTTIYSAGKLNQEQTMKESNLSRQLKAALLPVVILERYPKCTLLVNVTILQDDGSSLSAAITAASMALVDARVQVLDLVTSCTVAVVEPTSNDNDEDSWVYLADPTEAEISDNNEHNGKVALICLAMTPNQKEVTLWSQSGRLSSEMASHAMELCRDGCRTLHKFMRESWLSCANDGDAEMTRRQ